MLCHPISRFHDSSHEEQLAHDSMRNTSRHGGFWVTYRMSTLPLNALPANCSVILSDFVYIINVLSVIVIHQDTIKNIAQFSMRGNELILLSGNVLLITHHETLTIVAYTMISSNAPLLRLQSTHLLWIGLHYEIPRWLVFSPLAVCVWC